MTFVFRYADVAGPATRSLRIDGETVGKLRFAAFSAWDQWSFDACRSNVSSLASTIELVYAKEDTGAINLDRMTLGAFDEASVRLQNEVVSASGATPIQPGSEHERKPAPQMQLCAPSTCAAERPPTLQPAALNGQAQGPC